MKTKAKNLFKNSISLLTVCAAILAAVIPGASGAGTYIYVTNFFKTANAQSNLQSTFPLGLFTATNAFATPFDIVSDTNTNNFSEITPARSTLVISNLDLTNVTAVFTLMNAYTPPSGPLATVTFLGSAGASETFTLNGGVDIRDFFNGQFADTINQTTTQTAYQVNNVTGGAATGNSSDGSVGAYREDEQEFVLNAVLASQTLTTIVISNVNSSATPILLGATAFSGAPPPIAYPGIPFSETFTNTTYSNGWTFTTFNPDSSNYLNGTDLTLVASYQDNGSDLYSQTEYAAPRLLQPVNPGLDWVIQTELAFDPSDDYQGAGILLANTAGAFSSASDYSRIGERAFYPDEGGSVIQVDGAYTAYTDPVCYMRLQKLGTNYTGWYSSDGVDWTLSGSQSFAAFPYIGLFAVRYAWDSAPVDSDASFYYFEVNVIPPALNIQPNGNGALLSWPATASIYGVVESFAPGGPWTASTNNVTVANGICQMNITPEVNAQFFRLVYPAP